MTGHLLGGAGGLEAGITILALRDQVLPPTINLDNPDPECDLDYGPNVARKAPLNIALSNSFGFVGTNGSLIFRRWTEGVREFCTEPPKKTWPEENHARENHTWRN